MEKGQQRVRAAGGRGGQEAESLKRGRRGWCAARAQDPREVLTRAHQGVRLSQEGEGTPRPRPRHLPEQTWALAEAKGGG